MRNASTSNPESVSSKIANCGFSINNCKISLFFFSPPENPSLIDRFRNESSKPSSDNTFLAVVRNSTASISSFPSCLFFAFNAALKKYAMLTPGIATGYWKHKNNP